MDLSTSFTFQMKGKIYMFLPCIKTKMLEQVERQHRWNTHYVQDVYISFANYKYISCITINLMYYIISLCTMIIIIDTIDYYMITMHFCLYYPRNKVSSVEHNQFNNHHFPPEKYMESIFRLLNTVILVTCGINNANTHFVSQHFPIFFVFYTTVTIER